MTKAQLEAEVEMLRALLADERERTSSLAKDAAEANDKFKGICIELECERRHVTDLISTLITLIKKMPHAQSR